MRVSCSSEGGDSPQYSWTLDGRTLTDAELLSINNETNIITLKQHVSGRLVCSVRNNVSNVFKEQKISPCGVETYCDGRQDGAQCYGALGGSVEIKLMDSTAKIPRYHLLKNSLKILDVRKKRILYNIIEHKFLLFPSNGTLRLNYLSRTDSGNYSLKSFDSDGKASDEQTLQLFVQAPVSSVLLVSECLSQGERRVSCSSEGGDSPQYSWTLDGRTLTDAELLSVNNETNIITLRQHMSGHLVCSVRNNVSNVFIEHRLSTCALSVGYRHQDKMLICGLRAVVVILLLIGIPIYFAWKKKKHAKAEVSAVPQTRGDPEDSLLMVEISSATYTNT
ncbi:uncharacterized protein LOC101487913 [Maylandia zebra]|uniref:uncharacterized protein LOC101487913 n=1 Tax=Maylandia zebra TaxID=106582 RepID=UPI00403CD3E2